MRFSYIGLKEPVSIITPYIFSFIRAYRLIEPTMPPLEAGGVYSSDYNESANFASVNEMAVYTNANDVIKNSDILFCFLSDKGLKSLKNDLKGHGIRDKIFCHFSPSYDSDILSFDEYNTYISLYVPMYEIKDGNIKVPTNIFVEGYGPKYHDFLYTCQILSIPVHEITKEDKLIYKTAANFIYDYKKLIDEKAEKLFSIALYDNSELCEQILKRTKDEKFLVNSYDPVAASDVRYIEKQSDMFSDIGLNDVSILFATMLLAQTHNSSVNDERIRTIINTILQK